MKITTILIVSFISTAIFSQSLLVEENFEYPLGDTLSHNGWTAYQHNGVSPIDITSGLSFNGYPSSGIGNAALVDDAGEDIFFPLSSQQTTGNIYMSFLVNISNATTASGGDFFIGLGSSGAGSIGGRLYLRKSGSKFAFGLSKAADSTIYTDYIYDFNTTYLIVIKYIINSGSSNDDAALFIFNGSIPETEPTPDILKTGTGFSDPANISVIVLEQRKTTNIVTVDGIRVSTLWSQAPLPVELTSFSASVIGSKIKLNWSTATEINNFGFDVERQNHTSASLSETSWEKIGFVSGNGNSNSPKNYSSTDNTVSFGKYNYRLKQIDNDGKFEYSKTVEVNLGSPKSFKLGQNYPNPFNPTTTISFNLPEASNIKLTIYNLLGQEVKVLVDEFKEAGSHTTNFDAVNLNSGLYIYKLQAGSFTQTKKMTLIK